MDERGENKSVKTLRLFVDLAHLDSAEAQDALERGAQILRAGGSVALPTETVYGLGANALDAEAVGRIFAAKQRPAWDPVIVHIAGLEMLEGLVEEVPAAARRLTEAFWPGPMTLLAEAERGSSGCGDRGTAAGGGADAQASSGSGVDSESGNSGGCPERESLWTDESYDGGACAGRSGRADRCCGGCGGDGARGGVDGAGPRPKSNDDLPAGSGDAGADSSDCRSGGSFQRRGVDGEPSGGAAVAGVGTAALCAQGKAGAGGG